MGKAADFYAGLNESIKNAVRSVSPFRAKVHSVAASGVQITPLGSDVPMDEPYARLAGPSLSANDDVAVMMLGDRPFVLGKIVKANEAASTLEEFTVPTYITSTNDVAFTVRDASNNRVFRVDTNGVRYVYIENDGIITGHRASDGAQKYWIKSVDGSASFAGRVNAAEFVSSGLGSIGGNLTVGGNLSVTGTVDGWSHAQLNPEYFNTYTDPTPTTSSTTATGSFITQGEWNVTLPTGTWTVYVLGIGRLAHSAAGNASFRMVVAGVGGTIVSGQAAGTSNNFSASINRGGMSGAINIQCQARSNTAGTLYTGASTLMIMATRTS